MEAIASLVEAGSELIDIGSDHGYLPLFLLENGIVDHIAVSDIGDAPLQNARKTLEGKPVDFYLADGLPANGRFDAAVLAGMGGHTIAGILEKDRPRFLRMRYLLLQPMQHLRELREYLLERGFRVVRERMAHEEHYYVILKVVPGEEIPYDLDLGKDINEDIELYDEYLRRQAARIRGFYADLPQERAEEMKDLLTRIAFRLENMV